MKLVRVDGKKKDALLSYKYAFNDRLKKSIIFIFVYYRFLEAFNTFRTIQKYLRFQLKSLYF